MFRVRRFSEREGVNAAPVQLERSSGILLHPTSLPGGKLGAEAYRFVDWLEAAGQKWWQVLPLGPPDDTASPYMATSAFAGSPGLLADPDAEVSAGEVEEHVASHPYWIADWTAYSGAGALADQVRFQREWGALREYAAARGVRLFGDLPIYVATEGADVRSKPELFQSDEFGGAPPDDFSETGQLWGNPLYDWHAHRADRYRWWTERLRRTFELVDMTRIDHFRGFVAYWAVPAGARDARNGRWRPGPGRELFDAATEALGELQLVAENLGVITPPVEHLRHELELPGMVVLQFGFAGAADNPHRPENHEEQSVVYTGTHDHDTIVGWLATLTDEQRAELARQLARHAIDEPAPHWALVRLALASRAALAILPAQDVLGLGSEARMNYPGRTEGNWGWRLEPGSLTRDLAARLRAATEAAGRA
jgi:4-alpha-glucanotransferase